MSVATFGSIKLNLSEFKFLEDEFPFHRLMKSNNHFSVFELTGLVFPAFVNSKDKKVLYDFFGLLLDFGLFLPS